MSRTLTVDQNNDIFVALDGNLSTSRDIRSVMQCAQTAAQAQLGEMVLAIDQGVPNFQTVWRDAANVAQFEAFVRRAIMSVEGVVEVKDFSVVVQDNKVQYVATIVTIYGSEVLTGGG